MTDKLRQAIKLALDALEGSYAVHPDEAIIALREALAEQADVKESFTTQFIPVGIVNDQHCITWMEEIVDDQAPIGAILYAKEQL